LNFSWPEPKQKVFFTDFDGDLRAKTRIIATKMVEVVIKSKDHQ
jgi:hypothetical protein